MGGSQTGRLWWFQTLHASRFAALLIAISLLLSVVAIARADDADANATAATLHTAPCKTCQRPDDEVWVIDDRHAGCLEQGEDAGAALRFERFDIASDTWHAAKATDFFDGAGAALPACYWVHGDRIDPSEAKYAGLTVYRRLVEGDCKAPPLRFVIWSWPTTQVYRRPVPDVRLKASRTAASGYRLAWVLSRSPQDAHAGLIGYSFGARVITGALHVLGGGELDGHALENRPPVAPRYRAALMASATDYDWLEPDMPHGMALKSTRQMLLINNSCDRILAHYRLLACDRHGPPALGYCGVRSMAALGPDGERVGQFDACCEVGSQHSWRLYVASETIMIQVRETALPK